MMLVKHLLFRSKIELPAGKHARTEKKYGLQLARLAKAKEFIDQAVNKCSTQTFNPVLCATQDEINK